MVDPWNAHCCLSHHLFHLSRALVFEIQQIARLCVSEDGCLVAGFNSGMLRSALLDAKQVEPQILRTAERINILEQFVWQPLDVEASLARDQPRNPFNTRSIAPDILHRPQV